MSEPALIDPPVGLRWVKLVCRLGRLVSDSEADEDAYPDILPVGGKLTLAASPSRVRIQEADGRWRSIELAGRTYTIRADGELVDGKGRVGVWIPDPASPLVEPQGYGITAVVKPLGGTEWSVTFGGSAVLPDVVDLVAVSSVGSVSPSVTASFDARLYALEQGGGVDGGTGFPDGAVPIFETLAQAEAWEAANPGRIALTIESPADTADPTWTATLTVATPNGGTATVTASALATDDTAVVGYDYSIGGVTWTPITPAGNVFTITGLTGETTYSTVLLRARDAAGNFTALSVPTFTTPAALAPAPTDYVYRWLGADITATTWTDTEAGLVLTKEGGGVPSVEDGAAVYPGGMGMSAESAPLLTATDATYVYAYKLDDAEKPGFLAGGNNTTSYVLVSPEYGTLAQVGTWKGATTPPNPAADTNWHVVVVRWAGANPVRITLDGTTRQVAPRNATGVSHEPFNIGGGAVSQMTARFKEAQFFNRSLSDGEVASVTDDLKTKYGI